MEYEVVFDASTKGYNLFPIGLFLVMLSIWVGIWFWGVRNPEQARRQQKNWRGIMLCFLVLLCIIGGLTTFLTNSTYAEAQQILADGRASVVEGPIVDFNLMSDKIGAKRAESFSVAGIKFAHSPGRLTAGYNTPSDKDGPLREGLFVRIHYAHIEGDPVDPTILKLEVRK